MRGLTHRTDSAIFDVPDWRVVCAGFLGMVLIRLAWMLRPHTENRIWPDASVAMRF